MRFIWSLTFPHPILLRSLSRDGRSMAIVGALLQRMLMAMVPALLLSWAIISTRMKLSSSIIPTTGALEPGATPKDMELLAYIDDRETYDTIKKISHDLFQQEAMEDEQHPIGYVPELELGLMTLSLCHIYSRSHYRSTWKLFQASTRLILRSKNNWGGDKVDFTCSCIGFAFTGEVVF